MPEAGWSVLTVMTELKKEINGEDSGEFSGVSGDTENIKVFRMLQAYKDQELEQEPEVEFTEGEEEVEMKLKDGETD